MKAIKLDNKKCNCCGRIWTEIPASAKPMLDGTLVLGMDWQCGCGTNLFKKTDGLSPRLMKFNQHNDHPMFQKLMKKLSKAEKELCVEFIKENANLSNDEFILKVNRWFLDSPNKPTHLSDMWALVLQSVVK